MDTNNKKIFLNLNIEKALRSYLDAKGLDYKSKDKYLEFFRKFANVQGELNQGNLDVFLKHNNNPPARAMLKHLLKAISRWDFPMEIVGAVAKLDIPRSSGKKEKKDPLILNFKELTYLIEHMKGDSIIDERNRLSILTQWWGGLRITELVNISLKDLETEKYDKSKKFQKIKIRSESAKFRKEGYCWIPSDVYFRITKYINRRCQTNGFAQKLDLGESIWGFSNSAYDKLVRKKTKAILGRAYNTHSLRHGRGTDLMRKGVPIEKIKEILRHKDISSTQIYVHLADSDIENSLK
jgi:site-specific recombinase XerD